MTRTKTRSKRGRAAKERVLANYRRALVGLTTLYKRTDVGFDVGYTLAAERALKMFDRIVPAKGSKR